MVRTKRGSSPGPGKIRVKAPGYGSDRFRLSLRYLDSGEYSPWPFHDLAPEDVEDLGALLSEVALETWEYIETCKTELGKPAHGHRPIGHRARERLAQLEFEADDIEALIFRFRVTQQKRLWGIRQDGVFYALWWDPEHDVGAW